MRVGEEANRLEAAGTTGRLLLALIGSSHGGQVHGVSVRLSHPPFSPFLVLCFGEGALMGH